MEVSQLGLGIVVALVLVALAFDFMNGFHDAANSIATVVSTRVLKPYQAVMLAAVFNFIALFVFQLQVATTIGRGIIDQGIVDHYLVFGALIGAISLEHDHLVLRHSVLVVARADRRAGRRGGGQGRHLGAGSGRTAEDDRVHFRRAAARHAAGRAADAGGLLDVRAKSTPSRVDRWFRRLQLVSASLYSLGHGGNDAQKTIGIIWMLLIAAGYLGTQDPVPVWVIAACYITIALGTAFGGWRIVKTMGQRITKLKPVGGCCAETGGAIMLFVATGFGIPVSTTHTITGAIVGVGSAQSASAVRWGVAGNILWAWILTIPCSAFIAGAAWYLGRLLLAPS